MLPSSVRDKGTLFHPWPAVGRGLNPGSPDTLTPSLSRRARGYGRGGQRQWPTWSWMNWRGERGSRPSSFRASPVTRSALPALQ